MPGARLSPRTGVVPYPTRRSLEIFFVQSLATSATPRLKVEEVPGHLRRFDHLPGQCFSRVDCAKSLALSNIVRRSVWFSGVLCYAGLFRNAETERGQAF